jgi:protein KRI1
MDCENLDKKSNKKQTKLAQALLKKKPLFDENEKTFEEYFDEYYKLDCEDIIGGDIQCRFKYREVVPNDFGLNMDEV